MNESLKIAVVAACPLTAPRGTPVRIFRTAEALAKRGHEVHVVTYNLGDGAADLPFRVHQTPSVGTHRHFAPGPSYRKLLLLDPLLARETAKVLKRHRPDLIHAHHVEGLLVGRLARGRAGPPLIYDAHTLVGLELPYYGRGFPGRLKQVIGRQFDRRLPGMADHTIAVNDEILADFTANARLPAQDITVIPNGVECEHFDVAPPQQDCASCDKILVFAGNLGPHQGIEPMLRAFQAVQQQRDDVRLQLVTSSGFESYETLAENLGVRNRIAIVKAGFQELPHFLAAADVALNPRADGAGSPLKVLNYMAAGRPIVSFAASAKGLEHGKTGWLVEDGNVTAFATGVLRLLRDDDLARRLGDNARNEARSNYSWEKTAARVEAVYHKVLGAPPSGRARGDRRISA